MTRAWDELSGICLPQGYCLEKFLAEEDGRAFYQTTRGSGPALLMMEEGSDGDRMAAWEGLAAADHPYVQKLFECGTAKVADSEFQYALLEWPEDNLQSALDAGAISDSDASDVLAAVEPALRFLHGRGIAHRAVDPRHILAVGDSIKLSAYAVTKLSPGGEEADWRSFEALRRKLRPAHTPVLAVVPEVGTTGAPAAGERPAAAAPVRNAESERPLLPPLRRAEISPVPPPRGGLPVWVLGTAALAMILGLVVLLAMRRTPQEAPPAVAESATPVPAPSAPPASVASAPAQPTPTPPAPVHNATPPSVAERAVPAPATPAHSRSTGDSGRPSPFTSTATGPANWRVIAFTYNRRADAELEVEKLKASNADLDPSVFSPQGEGQAPFLISLRGRMTRDEANALRREALDKGLPHSTYTQNFSH